MKRLLRCSGDELRYLKQSRLTDRAACRAAVSARFTAERMAGRYLNLYLMLLG
jgi:hypothetical protein